MQIKRFIACAVLYLVVVGAIVYLFEGGSYELHLKFAFLGSDIEYTLNLPIAVWMILPPAILTIFCVRFDAQTRQSDIFLAHLADAVGFVGDLSQRDIDLG